MKKTVAIIGGGPSALLLATFLDTDKYDVTVYEKNKWIGRKFLVAGQGGFNLSYAEPMEDFVKRYTPNIFLANALHHFDNTALRNWLANINIPTFIGSSNRVFPEKGTKPIEVLNKILAILNNKGIQFECNHEWIGWDANNDLIFNLNQVITADYYVYALGGSSWRVTGSTGSWRNIFSNKGIKTLPFQPANCAYKIEWPTLFIDKHEGKPLKNIAISCDHKTQKGEVVITKFGIEGNAIYALSSLIQSHLIHTKKATVYVDLKQA